MHQFRITRRDPEERLSPEHLAKLQTQTLCHPSSTVYSRVVEFSYARGLSTREAAVLMLAAGAGVNRKEAAHRLGCRPATVDTYWQRILRKCGMGSQLEVFAALLTFSLENLAGGRIQDARLEGTMVVVRDLAQYSAAIDSVVRGKLAMSDGLQARRA